MIQGWMSEDLNLKGNELLAYALIYGFCQDEESEFTGSIKYIMRWLNCSKPTVLKAVDNLVKKGLVIKKQEQKNNVTFNHFTVNFNVVNKYFTPSKETLPLVKKLNEGSKETLQGGSKETLPNNIYNNKDNNTDTRARKYPSFDEFKEYANTTAQEKFGIHLDQIKLKAKFISWSENNWINGNGKKIKNWKTTLTNSIPYLKSEGNADVKKSKPVNGAKQRGFRYT